VHLVPEEETEEEEEEEPRIGPRRIALKGPRGGQGRE